MASMLTCLMLPFTSVVFLLSNISTGESRYKNTQVYETPREFDEMTQDYNIGHNEVGTYRMKLEDVLVETEAAEVSDYRDTTEAILRPTRTISITPLFTDRLYINGSIVTLPNDIVKTFVMGMSTEPTTYRSRKNDTNLKTAEKIWNIKVFFNESDVNEKNSIESFKVALNISVDLRETTTVTTQRNNNIGFSLKRTQTLTGTEFSLKTTQLLTDSSHFMPNLLHRKFFQLPAMQSLLPYYQRADTAETMITDASTESTEFSEDKRNTKVTIIILVPKVLARKKYMRIKPLSFPVNRAQLRAPGDVKCFTCGMNETGLSTNECYDFFNNPLLGLKKQYALKTKCEDTDSVHKLYKKGCFKRFLDVSEIYYERGCRTYPPKSGKSYASKRLSRLEYVLKSQEVGCVASPYASLTPFSRAISLYVRYHVCVCVGLYCNGAKLIQPKNYFNLIISLLIVIKSYFT